MRTGLEVEEAQRIVLAAAAPLVPESVAAADALGRVLAAGVTSNRTLPPAACSAMDGYALRAADIAGASAAQPVELLVAFEVAAGALATRTLGPREAARIFTGAPLPPGADAVVRQEDTEPAGARVRVGIATPQREHVREAGEDVRAGDVVLEAGARLGPAQLGMLASIGRAVVSVHRRPRVALLSSGDELVEPDGDVSGGRIVSSNAYALAAQCAEAGALATNLGIARDTTDALAEKLRAGLAADVLVSSAGVSVGDHDHVRPALERLGCELVFWGVQMKPGYPIAFGRFANGPLVFALPGNPVSAMVTFELFVRPLLLRMAGVRQVLRPLLRATLAETQSKKPGRLHFVRVFLERKGARWLASSTGSQSSGVLRSMTLAHGLLVFPADAAELPAGSEADVLLLDESVLAREGPA